MKAIMTKYLPATNTKCSRIKAFDSDKNSVTISYDYSCTTERLHHKAAIRLCEKMQWPNELLGGGINNGYVFVFKNQ